MKLRSARKRGFGSRITRLSSVERCGLLVSLLLVLFCAWTLCRSSSSPQTPQDEMTLQAAHGAIQSRRSQLAKITAAGHRIDALRTQSLPPDPGAAGTLYQNWLLTTLSDAGFQDILVIPNPPLADDGFHIVPFSVRFRGKLDEVRGFLADFSATPILHRIVSSAIETSQHVGEPLLECRMEVEALAIQDTLEHVFAGERLKNFNDTMAIAAVANPFQARDPKPAPVEPVARPRPSVRRRPPVQPPVVKPALRFVGILANESGRHALLYDYDRDATISISSTGQLQSRGCVIRVVEIESEALTLEVNDRRETLSLSNDLELPDRRTPVADQRAAEGTLTR